MQDDTNPAYVAGETIRAGEPVRATRDGFVVSVTPPPRKDQTVVEFLLSRLDEDEAAAGLEKYEAWWVEDDSPFDPDRVRVEIAAKRAIIEIHHDEYEGRSGEGLRPTCAQCGMPGEYNVSWPCMTIRHLVSVYADHPDYNPKWKS